MALLDGGYYMWPTPNTPDLGCFKRREHGLQPDDGGQFWTAVSPTDDIGDPAYPHQTYARVVCGKSRDFQRCPVWMLDYFELPPPDWFLGGDHPAAPSDWTKFPPQESTKLYLFRGQYRSSGGPWVGDTYSGHSFDLYDFGSLSTVVFANTAADLSLKDFVLEIAIVDRTAYFQRFDPPVFNAKDRALFQEQVLPKIPRRPAPILTTDEAAG